MTIVPTAPPGRLAPLRHADVDPADPARPTDVRSSVLDARWLPAVVGAAVAVLFGYLWGSLRQIPWIADEAAYVLQSAIFARGRWTAPPPPIPEFFEQSYILLRPVIASKYPPGHSLLLAPGTALGLPALVPVLLTALTGAFLFALARRLVGPWVGLIAVLIWCSAIDVLRYTPTYMSEVTTSTTWMVGWWSLLRWREDRRTRWLVVAAAAVSWCTITRPLTGVAFALPVLAIVLRDLARQGAWRSLAAPVAVGLAILGVVPIWSARTTGDWRLTPLTAYTRAYMPSDHPGLGLDPTPPTLALPADQARVEQGYRAERTRHTLATLPRTLVDRVAMLVHNFAGGGWRLALVPFLIVGLAIIPAAGWFALAASATLLLCYLSYAHPTYWTVYYLETQPVLAFVTACGLWWLIRRLPRVAPATAAFATCTVLALCLARDVRGVRSLLLRMRSPLARFGETVRALPPDRAIVFVRYAPEHFMHLSFVRNEPFLDGARFWFVYDRGDADNARLMAAAPDRAAYLADEATQRLTLLRPAPAR